MVNALEHLSNDNTVHHLTNVQPQKLKIRKFPGISSVHVGDNDLTTALRSPFPRGSGCATRNESGRRRTRSDCKVRMDRWMRVAKVGYEKGEEMGGRGCWEDSIRAGKWEGKRGWGGLVTDSEAER
jgi:hypothetical protein